MHSGVRSAAAGRAGFVFALLADLCSAVRAAFRADDLARSKAADAAFHSFPSASCAACTRPANSPSSASARSTFCHQFLPQNLAFASGDDDVFRVAAAARRRLPYVVLCKVWEATSCSMRARKFRAGCGHTPSIDCAESLRQSEQNLASDLLNFSFIITESVPLPRLGGLPKVKIK